MTLRQRVVLGLLAMTCFAPPADSARAAEHATQTAAVVLCDH